jgi:formate/nitrite transporter FocA (FNT family)
VPSPPERPERPEPEVEDSFDRLVEEGSARLARPVLTQLGTALLGGIDIGTGVLAYLVVDHQTHDTLLAGLAFSIGFVALLLAHSELFTENFLVPVTALAAGNGSLLGLFRLWGLSLLGNLAGGWVVSWLIIYAMPELRPTAREVGGHYAGLGANAHSLALAVLAGLVITLMTRMQHATDSLGVKIVPAILFGALLSGGQLFHSVLDSLLMFAGLDSGAHYGYGRWLIEASWATLGNLIGGIGLVTSLRLLRARHRVAEERQS